MIQEVQQYTLTDFVPNNDDDMLTNFSSKTKTVFETGNNNDSIWVTIGEKEATSLILNTCGDKHKHNILNTVLGQPMTISEILSSCKISNTSGYRKINSLIQSGLLIRNGFVITNGRKVSTYRSLFESVQIDIEKDKVIVNVRLSKCVETKHQIGKTLVCVQG